MIRTLSKGMAGELRRHQGYDEQGLILLWDKPLGGLGSLGSVHGEESAVTASERRFGKRLGRIASDFAAVDVDKPLFCRVLPP